MILYSSRINDFIEDMPSFREHYAECRRVNEMVLACMEKMRVENA